MVGKHEEAKTTLQTALEELTTLNAQAPGNPLFEADLLRAHDTLARLLSTWAPAEARDLDQALVHARKAVEGNEEKH